MPTVRSPLALVPAAAISPSDDLYLDDARDPVVDLYGSAAASRVINTMVEGVGGQEVLLSELLVAPELSQPMKLLLQFSLDPRFTGHSLGWLCAKANVTPGDVFLAFRDVLAAKATMVSMYQNSQALVPILSEIIQSAVTHTELCPACRGKKERLVKAKQQGKDAFVLKTIPCTDCQGTGELIVKADREAQKIVLDLVGLTKKSGMVINNQNVQANQTLNASTGSLSTDAAAGGLAQLQQATAEILFGRDATRKRPQPERPFIDAESTTPDVPAEMTTPDASPVVE